MDAQHMLHAPFFGMLGNSVALLSHAEPALLSQLAEVQWKMELSAKIAAIVEKMREKFSQNVCICQAWLGVDEAAANPNSLEVTLWADPRLGVVLDPLFQELRFKSCQSPVFFRNSMPGKVWRSGAVQIVQNLRILPPTLHPRSQLSEEALERLAEALYIPIYDLGCPAKGQVCVMEVLLSSRATEAMLVADVISFISSALAALQLSLANPVQQPVRRSVLCGRRARAPDSDGEASGGEDGAATGAGAAGSQAARPQGADHAAGGSGPSGSGAAGQVAGRQVAGAEAAVAACPGSAQDPRAVPGEASGRAGPGAAVRGGAAVCSGEAAQAVSEVPTLPASPSPERQRPRSSQPAATAEGAAAPHGDGGGGGCQASGAAVPRKVRKVLEGAIQRSKSVASVAALSNPSEEEEEEEDAGAMAPNGRSSPADVQAGIQQHQVPPPCAGAVGAGARGCSPLDPRPAAGRFERQARDEDGR